MVVRLAFGFCPQRREHLGEAVKTVVLVSGQMRTADRCADGIRAIYPDATFVVHAVADADAEKAFLFRPAVTVIEPQHEMPERREYSWQIGRGCHGVQRVIKQLWGLRRAWQVFEASGIEADCIVRCRPDLTFSVPPEPPENSAVYIPTFCNWFGLNDRFAFGGLTSMRMYMTRFDLLDEYIDQGGIFHPETFLAWVLRDAAVQRTRAVFSTLRPDGTLDEPIWSTGAGDA
jgi:hypothetical protein